jgi:hypothetical protein
VSITRRKSYLSVRSRNVERSEPFFFFFGFVEDPGPGRSLRLFWSTAKEQGNGRFSVGSMERCLASMEVQVSVHGERPALLFVCCSLSLDGGWVGVRVSAGRQAGRKRCSHSVGLFLYCFCSRNRSNSLLGVFFFHADDVDEQRRLSRKIKKSSEAFLTLGAGCRSRGQGVSLVGEGRREGGLNQQGPEDRASGAVREAAAFESPCNRAPAVAGR